MDCALVAANIARIEVRKNQLAIFLKPSNADATMDVAQGDDRDSPGTRNDLNSSVLLIPWCKPPSKKFREILLPPSISRQEIRPIKAERRAALIKSIARGRAWLDEIVLGTAGVEQIAARHKCSIRHVNMTISLAFIAPALVKAALEGRLPRGVGVASLRDAPAQWSRQFERLGLAKPASQAPLRSTPATDLTRHDHHRTYAFPGPVAETTIGNRAQERNFLRWRPAPENAKSSRQRL